MKTMSISEQKKAEGYWLDQQSKRMVLAQLAKIYRGSLVLSDQGERYQFGDGNASHRAEIHVHDASAYTTVLLSGTIGSGEAYMQGSWSSPDIEKVVELFLMNKDKLNNMQSFLSNIKHWFSSVRDLINRNTITGAKKNIRSHYDLNNDFFALFLDASMMYSSAIYSEDAPDLESAAINKLDHICKRLNLCESDHLVEIGTGWGGMAIHAAQHYGCKVTTTTISDEQFEYAQDRVHSLGLQNQITLLNKDYRLLEGKFDKLVSIEMIEAVGHRYLKQFFGKCNSLLKDSGLALIQAITNGDQRFIKEKDHIDFIRKYIFPGGCLPSNAIIAETLCEHTNMHKIGYEDITFHYADTLADWRERFHQALPKVRALGFDDVFIRMWDFYLAYCEGGFRQRVIHTGQFLFAKPEARWLPSVG